MKINPIEPLLVNVLLSSVLLIVLAVVVMLAMKYRKYRSRPYLISCCFFLFQFLGIGGILLISMISGNARAPFDTILRPGTLITGFTTIIFILTYIIDIKLPGKSGINTLLLGVLPFVAVSAALLLVHPSPLHSLEEVIDNISRADVYLRLIIVAFYIIYPAVVVCLPYQWRSCMVSRKMLVWLQLLTCTLAPIFIAGMSCGYFPAVIVNYVLAIILDALVVYIELKIRIPVPQPILEHAVRKQIDDSVLESSEIWMNPDLTVGELTGALGTNHKYLLQKVKDMGYSSYADMVNRKRIEYVCKRLEKESGVNITGLMFEAGFRSRSTASREFKRIVGCAPSEYQKSLQETSDESSKQQ